MLLMNIITSPHGQEIQNADIILISQENLSFKVWTQKSSESNFEDATIFFININYNLPLSVRRGATLINIENINNVVITAVRVRRFLLWWSFQWTTNISRSFCSAVGYRIPCVVPILETPPNLRRFLTLEPSLKTLMKPKMGCWIFITFLKVFLLLNI